MSQKKDIYLSRRRKRKKRPSKLSLGYIAIACAVVLAFNLFAWSGGYEGEGLPPGTSSEELKAVVIPDEQPEIKKDYTGFSVSFNPAHRIPNYVAWELTAAKAQGSEPRKSDFHPDNDVYGCPSLNDYKRSGFDRGHMAPAADMKWSKQAMYDSHALTNMCPQENSVNTGRWNTIEKLERKWAIQDSVLIIIAGPVLTDEITRKIGNGVSVPERFFKVILAPYSNPPRAIGFLIPNYPTQEGAQQLAVSVDEVEAATGYDFFSTLPDDIEAKVESTYNFNQWQFRK